MSGIVCVQDFALESEMVQKLSLISNCGSYDVRILEYNLTQDPLKKDTRKNPIDIWKFSREINLGSDFVYLDTDYSRLLSFYNTKPLEYTNGTTKLTSSHLSSKICNFKNWLIVLITPSDDSSLEDLGLFIVNTKNRNFRISIRLRDYGFRHLLDLHCMPNNQGFTI